MRPPPRPRGFPLGFNLTPMIDVVFNLIVFFLVASHFSRAEPKETLRLPSATQAADADQEPHRLTINVTPDGTWKVGGKDASLEVIGQMIATGAAEHPTFAVHIRGDRAARYEFIEPLLQACAEHGVTAVKFHVEPR